MRRIVPAAAAAWLVLIVAFAAPEYILRRAVGEPVPFVRALLNVVPHYTLWAVLALPIIALARRFPIERPRLGRRFALHAVFAFGFYGLDVAISHFLLPAVIHDPRLTPSMLRLLSIRIFYDDFLLYWGIAGVVHLLRETKRRAQLEREFAIAQLSTLRAQLQPHFLFNTLNTIAELLHVNTDAAERMTASLAELLRGTLELGDAEEVELRDELRLLDLYLAIQEVRFSDSITIERQIDPAATSALVPPLLLQPLVENAFRHGLARRRKEGRLIIAALRNGDKLQLEVRDNGAGLPAVVHEGIGLRNTRVRLEQLHGSAQQMTVAGSTDDGARVTITLPFREAAA